MEIGKRIGQFREAKGYSVNKLANLSGVSQSYLRDIELGNKNPTVEMVSTLCDALEISLKEFFDESADGSLFSDPLFSKLYKLTPNQRQALGAFLDSIHVDAPTCASSRTMSDNSEPGAGGSLIVQVQN